MVPCRACGLLTGEANQLCTYCRVRNRFWAVADDLPAELRSWGVTTLRIWTGILQEEIDKHQESQQTQADAQKTVRPKSGSPGVPETAPVAGSQPVKKEETKTLPEETPKTGSEEEKKDLPEEKVDKSWIAAKKEEDIHQSPKHGERGFGEDEGRILVHQKPIQ